VLTEETQKMCGGAAENLCMVIIAQTLSSPLEKIASRSVNQCLHLKSGTWFVGRLKNERDCHMFIKVSSPLTIDIIGTFGQV
jgi:hypothetical protein